ncbi:hypothetical protein ACIPF8_05595 [Collimonas sp. NPDC087041]|uniref:hypothetical protein n=1 Tax=Collimonas sp. NPDC087041 TaxID=3363960 RepID=UPI00381F09D5
MPAISRPTPRSAARRSTLLIGLTGALLALACIVLSSRFLATDVKVGQQQDSCLAAHAADLGISSNDLTSDKRYQPQLVAALSSCTGMAP